MNTKAEIIRTWKVEATEDGIVLTLNGKPYRTLSAESIAFDLRFIAERMRAGDSEGAPDLPVPIAARPHGPWDRRSWG